MNPFTGNNLILAIDPGEQTHGVLVWNTFHKVIEYANPKATIAEIYNISGKFKAILIEDYDAVHGAIGNSCLETLRNIGRLHYHFTNEGYFVHLIGRTETKKYLKAKDDTTVRKALVEIYGNKVIKELKSHCLPALAIITKYESI